MMALMRVNGNRTESVAYIRHRHHFRTLNRLSEGRGHTFESCRVRQSPYLVTQIFFGVLARFAPSEAGYRRELIVSCSPEPVSSVPGRSWTEEPGVEDIQSLAGETSAEADPQAVVGNGGQGGAVDDRGNQQDAGLADEPRRESLGPSGPR